MIAARINQRLDIFMDIIGSQTSLSVYSKVQFFIRLKFSLLIIRKDRKTAFFLRFCRNLYFYWSCSALKILSHHCCRYLPFVSFYFTVPPSSVSVVADTKERFKSWYIRNLSCAKCQTDNAEVLIKNHFFP